uniref:Uncharacterized protein n=1 Tax=Anguilla anguilla TaxID=7936 RepID=A0A0E9TPR5_ANGAN
MCGVSNEAPQSVLGM